MARSRSPLRADGPAPAAPAAGHHAPDARPGDPALGLWPRLLLIDDDDDLLEMAHDILGADGYLVDVAYGALDGVHKALRFPPDVILLDVLMSGCDGLEIFDTIHKHERTCNVPVLALSSLAGRDASRLLLDMGFAALIEKPVNWPGLRRQLRWLAGGRTLQAG